MDNMVDIAKNLTNLFKECFPADAKGDLNGFHNFWEKTFQLMETEGFFDQTRIKERTQHLIKNTTEVLRKIRDTNLDNEDFVEELRQKLIQAGLLKPSLKYYGYKEQDIENPELPIGFYRLLSPYPQPEDSFSIFAPCVANMIQRVLDGATMCWLSSLLIFHKFVTHDKMEQFKLVADKMHKRFMMAVRKDKRDDAARQIVSYIDKLKAFIPFFPLLNSQIFYEEGVRFYRQELRKYYVSSTTSGLIVPEEFYGREFYYPGITRRFEPTLFSMHNYLHYDECEKLHEWDEHMQKSAMQFFAKTDKEIKNPFRSRYFIDGIMRASCEQDKEIHYQYDVVGVAKALHETYWKLPNERRDLYLEDVKKLFGLFYRLHCENNLTLYENPYFKDESNWITLSTGVNGFSLLSKRGEMGKKIIHGFKLNLNSLWALGLASDIFLMLNELSNFPVCTASAKIAQEIAIKWMKSRYDLLKSEFVNGRRLPEWQTQTKQNKFVESLISKWIGI